MLDNNCRDNGHDAYANKKQEIHNYNAYITSTSAQHNITYPCV